jgi:hypothetical protein
VSHVAIVVVVSIGVLLQTDTGFSPQLQCRAYRRYHYNSVMWRDAMNMISIVARYYYVVL